MSPITVNTPQEKINLHKTQCVSLLIGFITVCLASVFVWKRDGSAYSGFAAGVIGVCFLGFILIAWILTDKIIAAILQRLEYADRVRLVFVFLVVSFLLYFFKSIAEKFISNTEGQGWTVAFICFAAVGRMGIWLVLYYLFGIRMLVQFGDGLEYNILAFTGILNTVFFFIESAVNLFDQACFYFSAVKTYIEYQRPIWYFTFALNSLSSMCGIITSCFVCLVITGSLVRCIRKRRNHHPRMGISKNE